MNSRQIQEKYTQIYKQFFYQNHIIYSAPFVVSWTPGGEFCQMYCAKSTLPLRVYVGIENLPKSDMSKVLLGDMISYCSHTNDMIEEKLLTSLPFYSILQNYIKEVFPSLGGIRVNVLTESAYRVGLDFDSVFSLVLVRTLHSLSLEPVSGRQICESAYELMKKISGYDNILAIYTSFYGGSNPFVSRVLNEGSITLDKQISTIKTLADFFQYPLSRPKNVSVDILVVYSGVSLHNGYVAEEKVRIIDEAFDRTYFQGPHSIWTYSNLLLNILNQHAIFALGKLLYGSVCEYETNRYISLLGKARMFLYIFFLGSESFTFSLNCFWRTSLNKLYKRAMVLQNRLVAGGAYLLIAPYNTSRNGIEQVIEQNVKPEFPSAYIVYKSREDGVEEEGLRMEQNFEENYVHPLVGRELFMLRKFDGSCITGQFDEIVKNTSIDVIFDSVNDKVYVAGQKMTAKQINSQMSAVEMIQLFFSKGKCIISNTELSRNTYSKDKNTMNSKIIYPLTKALLERTGKKFVLKASGSLHVFDIFLDPDSVNMGVLEKVI